jgi:predicted PurR-regulated permease PerM
MAWLLSFILDPWVGNLVNFGMRRPWAAALVYLIVAGVVGLSGLIFIPLLTDQTRSFISALKLSDSTTPEWINNMQTTLNSYGISIDLNSLLQQQFQSFRNLSTTTLDKIIPLATSVLTVMFDSFLVLIFSFYFVLDGERIWKTFLQHSPKKYHDDLGYIKDTISYSFAGFLRTQVLMGLLMGIGTYLLLLIFGAPYAVTAATFAGVAMIVPVIGPFLSVIPPGVVALVAEPSRAVVLFALIFGLQALIVNIVGPLMFKRSIGLHPVLVLVSFLVGFKIAGSWGAVFAVPIAGVLLIIGSHLVKYLVGSAGTEIKHPQHL